MGRKKYNITATDRCGQMFRFLWFWKVSTTATLANKFFPEVSIEACYRRLKRLEKGGFIQIRPYVGNTGYIWSLDKNGFGVIKQIFPTGTQEGYLSECPHHDLVVAAVHLGEWIQKSPPGWEVYTEQLMRKIPHEYYPAWVPKSKIHRADGFWHFNDGNHSRTVALEVELSQKKLTDYETVGRYYHLDAKVDHIIWITGPRVSPKSIHTAIQKSLGAHPNRHSFITLESFEKTFWQSPVSVGYMVGESLKKILVQEVSAASSAPDSYYFFDTRKYPVKSVTKRKSVCDGFFI